MNMIARLSRLARDTHGGTAIETAFVVPMLATLALGTFEVGMMVSRQQELQSAASEAEAIVLAAASSEETAQSNQIEAVIEDSLGLSEEQFSIAQRFRCNTNFSLDTTAAECNASQPIYRYIIITVKDRYDPVWTNFGVGSGFDYNLERTIQIG